MKILVTFCGLQEQPNKPPMILVNSETGSTHEYNVKKHYLLNPTALIYALHQAEYEEILAYKNHKSHSLSSYLKLKGLLDSMLAVIVTNYSIKEER